MARNTNGRPATRPIVRRARTDSFEIINRPVVHPAARIAGLLIRMRAEIITLIVLIALGATLRETLGVAFALALIAVTTALILAVPQARDFVSHRATAVMTRHRLRQVLVERRCLNFSRAAPLFLWSHPTEVGETVWLLLRAGISPSDVEGEVEWIASGCFARDARVTPVRRMTGLVRVEVIRRDPLARELIASELDDWTATTGQRPRRGTQVVPPKPSNEHWSGTGNRAHYRPRPRPTLDEHLDVPLVVEHRPTTTPSNTNAGTNQQDNSDPAGSATPTTVPSRGGDWSDYV